VLEQLDCKELAAVLDHKDPQVYKELQAVLVHKAYKD
jgi:hypothetical protein